MFKYACRLHWIKSFIFSESGNQRWRENERVGGMCWGGSPNPWGKASALDREQISSSLDEYERVDWSSVWGGSEMQFGVPRLRDSEAASEEGREGGDDCITKQTLSRAHQSQRPHRGTYGLLIELFLE